MSPKEDNLIRQCFAAKHGDVEPILKQCFPQYTTDALLRRAAALGLIKDRHRYRWTDKETEVLDSVAHRSLWHIQRRLAKVSPPGVRRTRYAILNHICRNRIRTNLDGLNHTELAQALGVTRDTLHRYRESLLIRGLRKLSLNVLPRTKGTMAETGAFRAHQVWFYKNKEIRRFIAANPAVLDLGKVAKEWFIDLLAGKALLKIVARDYERKAMGRPRKGDFVYPVHGIYPRTG